MGWLNICIKFQCIETMTECLLCMAFSGMSYVDYPYATFAHNLLGSVLGAKNGMVQMGEVAMALINNDDPAGDRFQLTIKTRGVGRSE